MKPDDLQYIADASGKKTPTLRKYKDFAGLMFKCAVIHDSTLSAKISENFKLKKTLENTGFSRALHNLSFVLKLSLRDLSLRDLSL